MHSSFVRRANLGDITAKVGSQAVSASLLGTAVGITLSTITGSDPLHVMVAFVPVATVSVALNSISSYSVHLPTFNFQRMEIFASLFLTKVISVVLNISRTG